MKVKKHYKPIDVLKRRRAPVVVGAGPIFHRPAASFSPFGGPCTSTNGETETLRLCIKTDQKSTKETWKLLNMKSLAS